MSLRGEARDHTGGYSPGQRGWCANTNRVFAPSEPGPQLNSGQPECTSLSGRCTMSISTFSLAGAAPFRGNQMRSFVQDRIDDLRELIGRSTMKDKILVNGFVWGTREPLVSAIDYDDFANRLVDALGRTKGDFRAEASFAMTATATRGAYEFHTPDLNDPLETKWALLLPSENKEAKDIATALKPLVEHRKGEVIYGPQSGDLGSLEEWVINEYTQKLDEERPYYILMAGRPDTLPFRFQYLLDVHAAVGRLCFDRLDDYANYAKKVVDFETKDEHAVQKRALFFAPEHEDDEPTYLSRHYMTDPLVARVQEKGVPVSYLAAEEATLANLLTTLRGGAGSKAPALLYTASHGLGVPGANEEARQRLQGAICCQDYDGNAGVFCADRIPDDSFLHGSIVLTFACYGAGTPKDSDFFHWIRDPSLLKCRPDKDFVAALPKRLVAHPQGPLAFVGHIDPAWVHCFANPAHISNDKGWGSRMGPFRLAVEHLLDGATVGYAVKRFNEVYSLLSVRLANMEDQFRRDATRGQDSKWTRDMVDTWITRNDTQNFIVLGDPAVKAKMT